jgi:parvulin-like peptidyl-prolyl isomerase
MDARAAEVLQALEAGEGFAEVAQRFSEGPHASDGGLIGVVATSDLSESVASAVAPLDEGEWSTPIESDGGRQIFFVEKRFEESGDDEDNHNEALRSEARQSLQQQKSQDKLSSFFSSELYKNHAVDKKL